MEKKIQDFPFPGRYISGIQPGMWRQNVRYQRVLATLLGASLLWSVEAPGLGLGDVELNSYLNQPLDAEISLLAVDPSEAEQITVKLASPAAFDAAGIERLILLEELAFEVRRNASGDIEIGVTTKNGIKEPFLDFIIEVVWPNGRLLREYTLLLDPPVFTSQQAPSVAAPEMGFTVHGDDEPQTIVSSNISETQERVIPGSLGHAPSRADVDPLSVPTSSGELRVRRHETLWEVASNILPGRGFSVEQRMLGIFKINQDAFIDSNINNLKAGYVLREPTEEMVAELSKSRAADIARQHYQDWLSAKRLAAANSSRVAEATPGPAGLTDDTARAAASANAQARLSLVSPEALDGLENKAATGTDQAGLSSGDLALVMAQAEESKAETEALKSRITTLEEQLAMMERLITLKDDALVEMQRQLGGQQDQAASTVVDSVPQEGASEEVLPQPVEVVPETLALEGESVETPPVAQSKVIKPLVVAEPAPEESSILDMFLNPRILILAVGVLLVIAAALMVIRKRRESAEEDYQNYEFVPEYAAEGESAVGESVSSSDVETHAEDNMDFSGLTETTLAELSEADEFSSGALDAFQADEADIDPIAEADVYLAYRRFQQAEDLIKEAMQRHPDRSDLQVKLLEIYFAADNKEGFESQAEALFASLGGQENSVWPPVAEMGRELCHDHPLFGGKGSDSDNDTADGLDSVVDGAVDDLHVPEMAELDSTVENLVDELDLSATEEVADELDFSSLVSETDSSVTDDHSIEDQLSEVLVDEPVVGGDNARSDIDQLLVSGDELAEPAMADEVTSEDVKLSEHVDDKTIDQPEDILASGADLDLDVDTGRNTDERLILNDGKLESEEDSFEHANRVADLISDGMDEASDPLSDKVMNESVDVADLDDEVSALSFEALGSELEDLSGQSFGEKVEALSEDMDPLAEGLSELPGSDNDNLDDFTVSAGKTESLDDIDLTSLKPSAEMDSAAIETLASFNEEGDNVVDELSQSYGELEEVFTGLADEELASGSDDLFGGADMIGTKLDLARAYIDMEDHEGARGILKEVLDEGSDAQKQEAEEMMQKIG